jgi:hypothetical protein
MHLLAKLDPEGKTWDVLAIPAGGMDNGRLYGRGVLADAVKRGVFEGAKAYGPSPDGTRTVRTLVGWWDGFRYGGFDLPSGSVAEGVAGRLHTIAPDFRVTLNAAWEVEHGDLIWRFALFADERGHRQVDTAGRGYVEIDRIETVDSINAIQPTAPPYQRPDGSVAPMLAEAESPESNRDRAIRQAYRMEVDLYRMENAALAEIKAELEKVRKEILSILTTAPKAWQINQAQALLKEIERQIKAWGTFTTHAIGGRFPMAAEIGAGQVFAALGIKAGPFLSRDFIAVAYQTLPLMIGNVESETTMKIGRILRQAVMAQRSPFDAMQEIGTLTGKGVFHSALERGETILRTEYGRICQTANYTTLVDLAQDRPTLRKEWSAVLDKRTRPSHAAADGQIRKADEPFNVGYYPALYPHDPRLPASESVNCRCISVAQDASWL